MKGTVWRCRDKGSGALVAVKKMKEPPATQQDLDFCLREVKLLQGACLGMGMQEKPFLQHALGLVPLLV